MKKLLDIQNLSLTIDTKKIVNRFDLSIHAGELHVLMGPNGSGKSTIAYSLLGHPGYAVRASRLFFDGKDMKPLTTDARAPLGMQEEMLYRSLNEGFSGGEKKKAEVLQMLALKPKLAILDEPDSGLDVDALRRI